MGAIVCGFVVSGLWCLRFVADGFKVWVSGLCWVVVCRLWFTLLWDLLVYYCLLLGFGVWVGVLCLVLVTGFVFVWLFALWVLVL